MKQIQFYATKVIGILTIATGFYPLFVFIRQADPAFIPPELTIVAFLTPVAIFTIVGLTTLFFRKASFYLYCLLILYMLYVYCTKTTAIYLHEPSLSERILVHLRSLIMWAGVPLLVCIAGAAITLSERVRIRRH